jgi:molybdate transport system substrate-binding protein
VNVKAVLAKVRLGEADAGIVFVTDVTRDAARDVSVVDIPAQFNEIASYPIAPLRTAASPNLAARFIDFVAGQEGQTVLMSFGFITVPSSQPE